MRKQVGIWIDSRSAVIVFAGEGLAHHLFTNIAAHPSLTSSDIRSDQEDLMAFYGKIIERIYGAEAILIMGADRSTHELEDRLAAASLGSRIAGVKQAGSMTDRQIIESVSIFFGLM